MALLGASIQSILAEEFGRGPADPRGAVVAAMRDLVVGLGLQAVELFLDGIFLYPEVVDTALLEQVGRLQQELGVAVSAHLPYAWVDLSSANELTRRGAVDAVVTAVERCAPIDVVSFALHATGAFGNEVAPGVFDPDRNLWVRLMLAAIERSFADLRDRVPEAPLAVETLEGFPFEWQAPLVDRFGLAICCDVAHLVVRGLDPLAFLDRWLPRVRQLHIHGVREQVLGVNLRRRVDHGPLGGPGELVDVEGIMRRLTDRGFDGPVILENLRRADLEQSVRTLQSAARAATASPPSSPAAAAGGIPTESAQK